MSHLESDLESELNSLIENLAASAQNLKKLSESPQITKTIAEAVRVIADSYRRGGCLYVAGNGGSAADAQHLVAELVSKLNKNRTPIRGYALTTDTSILTAIGNDYGYEFVFSRQIEAEMNKNDVFLAITTSGNSPNILRGLEAVKKMGATSILLTGRDGGPAKALADFSIIACGENTAQIQEAHLAIYHNLCWLLERELVRSGICRYL